MLNKNLSANSDAEGYDFFLSDKPKLKNGVKEIEEDVN